MPHQLLSFVLFTYISRGGRMRGLHYTHRDVHSHYLFDFEQSMRHKLMWTLTKQCSALHFLEERQERTNDMSKLRNSSQYSQRNCKVEITVHEKTSPGVKCIMYYLGYALLYSIRSSHYTHHTISSSSYTLRLSSFSHRRCRSQPAVHL